jgi:hypothetical protein
VGLVQGRLDVVLEVGRDMLPCVKGSGCDLVLYLMYMEDLLVYINIPISS